MKSASRCRIGTSGYVYSHWREIFYPAGMPQKNWFARFAEVFDTVELNNSFYRLPSAEAFKSWHDRAPAGFLFAVKFSRYGSHVMRLKNSRDTIRRFHENAAELKDHLGPVLVQLPPRWKANPERLDEFLSAVPKRERWTVEFRDPSWLSDEVYDILRRHKVALCIHDKIPDHPREITTNWIYIRFHGGVRDGNYSDEELKRYAREIERYLKSGLDVYAYFNNDWHGYAINNALMLKKLLGV
jgi:uncharacterized protein YecE (DUF72 family)